METSEALVTEEKAKELGLQPEEFEQIQRILDRAPNPTELRIFAHMWSEQCSYKNSISWLNALPKEGKKLINGQFPDSPKLIDLGNDWAGILKFSLSYWIDELKSKLAPEYNKRLLASEGAPLSSQLIFNHKKEHLLAENLDSNVDYHELHDLSLGILKKADVFTPITVEPGQAVYLVCPPLSEGQSEDVTASAAQLDQIRKVIGGCYLSGIKVIGKLGIIAPLANFCVQRGVGIRLQLDLIPSPATPDSVIDRLTKAHYGQFLLVGKTEQLGSLETESVGSSLEFHKIGETIETEYLELILRGECVAHVPVYNLIKGRGAPDYQPFFEKPAYLKSTAKFKRSKLPKPKNYQAVAKEVFLNARMDPLSDAISKSGQKSNALLVSFDNDAQFAALSLVENDAYIFPDPFIGALILVAKASRKICCAGGEPLALCCNLSFGDPGDKADYWQFVQAVKGLSEVCKKFELPVLEQQVHFSKIPFEQNLTQPNLVVGMVGYFKDSQKHTPFGFQTEGDVIYMIGTPQNDMGSSVYLRKHHGITFSPVPKFDLDEDCMIQQNLRKLNHKTMIRSACDIAQGGLFVSLIYCALANCLGFEIETDDNFRKDAYLFGESQSRMVVTTTLENEDSVVSFLNSNNIPFSRLGEVKGKNILIDKEDFGTVEEWQALLDQK